MRMGIVYLGAGLRGEESEGGCWGSGKGEKRVRREEVLEEASVGWGWAFALKG